MMGRGKGIGGGETILVADDDYKSIKAGLRPLGAAEIHVFLKKTDARLISSGTMNKERNL